jgi:hypothetical protein
LLLEGNAYTKLQEKAKLPKSKDSGVLLKLSSKQNSSQKHKLRGLLRAEDIDPEQGEAILERAKRSLMNATEKTAIRRSTKSNHEGPKVIYERLLRIRPP